MNIRNSINSLINHFPLFLIAYQDTFREINNMEFFKNWQSNQKDIGWFNWSIQHLPGNYYLVGKKYKTQEYTSKENS